jgi:hypothetical protein
MILLTEAGVKLQVNDDSGKGYSCEELILLYDTRYNRLCKGKNNGTYAPSLL